MRLRTIHLVAAGLLAAVTAFGQSIDVTKLDMRSVQSIRLIDKGKEYFSETVVVFVNGGTNDMRIRNMTVKVSLKGEGPEVALGETTVDEETLPPGAEGKKVRLMLYVGPKDEDTFSRLTKIFNLMGNPATDPELRMFIRGEGEAGQKGGRGWFYQKGIGLDLEFKPEVQRVVLFK